MKNLFFLSFLLVSSLSFGQIMVLFEADTPDKNNMAEVAQNWFGAVKAVSGDDNGITMHHKGWASTSVYFTWWYDSLKDMAENIEKQESMNNKVMEYLGANPTDPELVQKFNSITDPRQNSVWEYVPELSQMDDFMALTKEERDQMQYRRFQYINVAMNAEGAYIDHQKKAYAIDEKRGVKYHVAVFKNVFGGKDSNYLSIIIDKNRLEYMSNFTERMRVRRESPDWGKNANPWDLTTYNVLKTDEIIKILKFSTSSK